MFRLIKKVFIVLLSLIRLLASMVVSDYAKWLSLNNEPYMIRPTLIDLNHDEYKQGWCYYPFMVNWDRCNGGCNTIDDPSGRIYVPNKT